MEWKVRENQNGSSELYHYGVKGMKWGVRKDDDKDSGQSKKNYTVKDQSIRTNVGVAKIKGRSKTTADAEQMLIDMIKQQVPDRYASPEEAQKKLSELESSKYTMAYTRGYDQAYLVNRERPNYMRSINCFECSLSMEMRNRGYNVQAKEMKGGLAGEVAHAFGIKDSFTVSIDPNREYSGNKSAAAKEAYNQMAKQCIQYGDGARGCLGISYADYDSGHSMYWVVENGEFKIIDAQDTSTDGYDTFLMSDAVDKVIQVWRLDNADLLPGVTDFVEPYAPVTDEEKAVKEKAKQPNMAEARAKKEADEKRNKNRKEREAVQRKAMKEMEANRSTVEKLIRKVKTVTNDLIAKGKRFLKNPLNIQKSEPIVTRGNVY